MRIEIAGENGLIVYLAETQNPALLPRLRQLADQLRSQLGSHLLDLVPSYASLLVIFDPLSTDHGEVRNHIQRALAQPAAAEEQPGRLLELPVYYSSESGPDLPSLATRAGLSVAEVIAIHQQPEYRVYAIGFAPGFAFLGEVDPRIATPRLATPRQQVPAGSVAIADAQTAVYPALSPGGWNLIGRCPTPMFTPTADPPMPLAVADRVRFQAIDRRQFVALGGRL